MRFNGRQVVKKWTHDMKVKFIIAKKYISTISCVPSGLGIAKGREREPRREQMAIRLGGFKGLVAQGRSKQNGPRMPGTWQNMLYSLDIVVCYEM